MEKRSIEEEILEEELEGELDEDDYSNGLPTPDELFEDDILDEDDDVLDDEIFDEESTEPGIYIDPDFMPDIEELRQLVETWNLRNEKKFEIKPRVADVLDQKRRIKKVKKNRRKKRKIRRFKNFGKIFILLGILAGVARLTAMEFINKYVTIDHFDLILIIGAAFFVIAGLAMYLYSKRLKKKRRKKLRALKKVLKKRKKAFYEEETAILHLQDEIKAYFVKYGIKYRLKSVTEAITILMERCGLDLPLWQAPDPMLDPEGAELIWNSTRTTSSEYDENEEDTDDDEYDEEDEVTSFDEDEEDDDADESDESDDESEDDSN